MKLIIIFSFLLIPVISFSKEIGVVLAGSQSVFWDAVKAGAASEAQNKSYRAITRGTVDDDTANANLQLEIIKNMIDLKVNGLIIAPNKLKNISAPIKYNLPVVVIDRESRDIVSDATLMTDNYEAGKRAALTLSRLNLKSANVAIFNLAPDVSSTELRVKGFKDQVLKMGHKIVIEKYVGSIIRKATNTIIDEYKDHTKIDIVFTPNERTTEAFLEANKILKSSTPPIHVGFDYKKEFKEAIYQKKIYSLVVQDAFMMGKLGAKLLFDLIEKKDVKQKNYVPVIVVDQFNVNDKKIIEKVKQYE